MARHRLRSRSLSFTRTRSCSSFQREAREEARIQDEIASKTKIHEKQQRTKHKNITVHVQILSGRRLYVLLHRNDTLDDIREKIKQKEGIHPDQQILLFNGIKLMDGTVHELNIHDGAVLFLTLRNRGG